MQNTQKLSFFNNSERWNPKEKIWKPFSLTRYQNDIIKLKSNCHYLSNEIFKQIYLEIGKRTLYYSKEGIHKGYLSLNFTTIIVKDYEGLIIICLQKNGHVLNLKLDGLQQVLPVLAKKCIQTSFHENYFLDKMIFNGNKKAKIFLAIRKETNQKLAVKAYSKEYISKFPFGKQCLRNEIKALRMLKSPHIIQLYEVHESENTVYLIMDNVNGDLLSDKMNKSLITEQNIQILMYNLLKVLNQIHQKNIIMRNMAPDNILLKNQSFFDLIITGFGEAQFLGQANEKPAFITEFMAPEVLHNKKIDAKCDIYSAGVILYKLIVKDDNCIGGQFNFLSQQFIEAPKSLQSLIKKMLRADLNKRYNAEKCLQHRYFKKLYNPHDNCQTPQNVSLQQEKYSPVSAKLLEVESGSSLNSNSSQSQQIIRIKKTDDEKKQQSKQSKFSKFCTQMQEFYSPQTNKKAQDDSLYKLAVINSQKNYQEQKKTQISNQIGGNIGFLKKSNSFKI